MATVARHSLPVFSAVRRQPVAPKSAAVKRRHIKHVAFLIGVGVALALLFVWVRIQVIHLGYEVSKVRKEVADLKEQKSLIEAEIGSLKSPSRIETIAKEKYGMRLPESDEIIYVNSPAENK